MPYAMVFAIMSLVSLFKWLGSQGRYQDMWLYCLRGQLDGRYLPLSDHHVRGFSGYW